MITLLRHSWLSCLLLLLTPSAFAGQAAEIAKVNGHLQRAEANLKLVDDAIGHLTQPPKGSAAKLAKMRLEQAHGDLEPAGQVLATLKQGDGLAEAVERYKRSITLYGKLRGVLTGEGPKPEPEPQPQPEPEPRPEEPAQKEAASKTVKLGYPHADNFKNTLFTLRRVEGDTGAILKLLEELRPVEDQLSISHRTVASAVANVTEAHRQAGFVQDGLQKIPSNGEGVAEAVQRLVNAKASLAAAKEYFDPLHLRLTQLVDPRNYPEFAADIKRLRELGGAYANPALLFREQRARAAEALAQGPAAKEECIRIAQTYARLLEQETDQGKSLEAAGNGFLQRYEQFLAAAEQQKTSLPSEIRAHLVEVDGQANDAVANQKPLWFTGGIPQVMGWVDDKFALYEVLDPAGAAQLGGEVAAMRANLRERADSLKELIIRENTLPPDRYAGADRDAVVAVAVDAWKVQQPEHELLAVRIPSEAWSRETKWTYSNGTWYFVDKSSLQVRLIVADAENVERAIDRPVNVRKDHQKGDTTIGVPLRSVDEALQPSEYLLRSKIP